GLGQLRGLFLRTSSLTVPWIPFRRAQFHPWLRQADRTVELPGGEKFFCRDNKWETYYSAPQSFRKELSGFLIKKTEACVREAVGYKPGLTVNASAINKARHFLLEHKTFPQQLNNAIENAVGNFFEKQNRVVVTVDTKNLKRIREEAHGTAEKLIVPEASPCGKPPSRGQSRLHANEPLDDISKPDTVPDDTESSSSSSPVSIWATLREALTETERHALSKLLENGPDAFKTFASSHGIMPEVLADGINEKAMDIIGDNILDFTDIPEIYDDYKDNIEIVHNPGLVSSGQSKEYKFLIEIIPSL
ncbi:MAG: hypothetical protein FWB91_14460, partial [Defluviitaleaceae bacterium]|nr:hypothetical protein [Defluviitaleaceae bacterium]